MVNWNREKIANLSDNELAQLHANALRLSNQEVANLCIDEIESRKPKRTLHHQISDGEDRIGQYVSEFHFVCPAELGVTRNHDATIWTGTWVVAERHAERGVRYGSVVALHSSKAELSYIQGTIKEWRKRPREDKYSGDQSTSIKEGIDFLIEPTHTPLVWKGDGSGEKGYEWASIPS